MASRRVGKLLKDSTVFMLCDMQEKFRPTIKYYDEIIGVAKRLVQAAKILEVPLIVTEQRRHMMLIEVTGQFPTKTIPSRHLPPDDCCQYPKGLGPTVSELEISHALKVCPKTVFSMVVPDVESEIMKLKECKSVILFGIECHVCIQQTCLDLLEKEYDVHIVADACSSRSMTDRIFGLKRMKQSGAFLTTSEAVLLNLVGDSKHPKFKEVQQLITTSAPDTGLLAHI